MGTLFRKVAGFIFFFSKKIKHFLWKRIYDRLANTYEYFDWAFMNYGFDYDDKSNEPSLGDKDEEYRYCIQLYHHTVEKLTVQDKTVLEVGCGPGVFYKPWVELNVNCTGIDINPIWKKFGKENVQNIFKCFKTDLQCF